MEHFCIAYLNGNACELRVILVLAHCFARLRPHHQHIDEEFLSANIFCLTIFARMEYQAAANRKF